MKPCRHETGGQSPQSLDSRCPILVVLQQSDDSLVFAYAYHIGITVEVVDEEDADAFKAAIALLEMRGF